MNNSLNIVLGTASLGSKVTFRDSYAVIKEFHDCGYRIVDTANVYGAGQSPSIIAQFITDYSVDDFEVTYKYGYANKSNSVPASLLFVLRGLLRFRIVRFFRRFIFRNKKRTYCRDDILNEVTRQLQIFGPNLKRLCFHDPSRDDFMYLIDNFDFLNFLKLQFGVEIGVSVGHNNVEIIGSSDLSGYLAHFDFLNVDCSLAFKYLRKFPRPVFLFSVFDYLLSSGIDLRVDFTLTSHVNFSDFKKRLDLISSDVKLIVDAKNIDRLHAWFALGEVLRDEK